MPPVQKLSMKQLTTVDKRLAVVTEYKNLWQKYFLFFADGFESRKIQPQEEQGFFQIMNALSTNHYRMVELAGDLFKDGNLVLDVLIATPSLSTLKQMSEATFGQLCIDWHTVFIDMNKAIGRLNMLKPQPKR